MIELETLISTLEDGESVRIVCPQCGGGSTKERSLSVTRKEGAVLYKCFRANCGTEGARGDRTLLERPKEKPNDDTPVDRRSFNGTLCALSSAHLHTLSETVGFQEWHIAKSRAMYAPDEGRVAFPILDPLSRNRGWVLRSYSGAIPKALTRPDALNEATLSWYVHPRDGLRRAVLVEDIPSAVRASKYRTAVSLNGTGLSKLAIAELSAHVTRVTWALDNDASDLAVRQMRKYAVFFHSADVLLLSKDLKNMSEEELMRTLGVEDEQ